tara:strand:+ start:17365 stop:18117 length:753 start_codon:yes stop_codon:yes gene_type:complete
MASITVWYYSLISVFIISLISLVGILALSIKADSLKKLMMYMVSFSAGALFGDTFIHLLPEIANEVGFTFYVSIYIIVGIVFSFIVEKVIHWQHCHHPIEEGHIQPFAKMNIFGDIVHNFLDGLIIGASYLVSIPVGIATTVAVILHEIPQEIGEFGVLIHGGFSKAKALFFNFIVSLSALVGVIIALTIGSRIENFTTFVIPFAAGSFIYIAGADLIPELHKETRISKSIIQFATFLLGISAMLILFIY